MPTGKTFHTDIILHLSRRFYIKASILEPYICLSLENCSNKSYRTHPFFNIQGYLNAYRLKRFIWCILNKGLENMGCFVRGHTSDIYELTIDEDTYKLCVKTTSENNSLFIILRVLVKFATNLVATLQPHPTNPLKRDWLLLLPSCESNAFTVSMPHAEQKILKDPTNLVVVIRLLERLAGS
uniref:Uncharacterized protein n=1 Tax=Glossina austeni TaxID=7395 RepID=A0A1A9UP12_GLOAU